MGVQFSLLAIALLPAILFTMPPQSPSEPRVRIAPTGRSELPVMPYNERTHAVFEPLFTDPAWARMRPFAMVLQNLTAHPILTLSVRWTYTHASGKPRTSDFRRDSLFSDGGAFTPAGTMVLIVPGAVMFSTLVNAGRIQAAPSIEAAEELTLSSNLAASIDAVILGDGEVIGPDLTGTLAWMKAGELAISTVARTAAEAKAAGQDPGRAIANLVAQTPNDTTGDWIRRLARMPNITTESFWRVFNQRPAVPPLHRK